MSNQVEMTSIGMDYNLACKQHSEPIAFAVPPPTKKKIATIILSVVTVSAIITIATLSVYVSRGRNQATEPPTVTPPIPFEDQVSQPTLPPANDVTDLSPTLTPTLSITTSKTGRPTSMMVPTVSPHLRTDRPVTVAPVTPPDTPTTVQYPCDYDNDCKNGVCARESAESSNLVCCLSGDNYVYWFVVYCTGQPVGAKCYGNKMCQSGVCVKEVCKEGLQGP